MFYNKQTKKKTKSILVFPLPLVNKVDTTKQVNTYRENIATQIDRYFYLNLHSFDHSTTTINIKSMIADHSINNASQLQGRYILKEHLSISRLVRYSE